VTISIAPTGSGTVTRNKNQIAYPPGSQVTLTAGGGFPFTGWSGDVTGNTNPLTITMDGNKNITASFQAYALTTNVTPAGSGTITRSPNVALYPPGPVTLTAVPANGYSFTSWSGDASGTNNPFTLTMDADKSVTAAFATPPPACGNWTLTSNVSQLRAGPGAAWDPVNHRVLRFGGFDGTNFLNDLWSYTIANGWTQLSPAGPLPGAFQMPLGSRDPAEAECWLFVERRYATQRRLAASSGTPSRSEARQVAHRRAALRVFPQLDPVRDRVILFGEKTHTNVWGAGTRGNADADEAHSQPSAPSGRYGHAAIYDPVRDRMLVQGAIQPAVFSLKRGRFCGNPTWTAVTASAWLRRPPSRAVGTDAIRDRMLVVRARSRC
jgi:uncharacterized repeat protein (TIGR02543 family)